MNGRVYDPMLARVLSPDNLLPNMYSQSGLNRYAYCHNNPLMYSDPDGNNPIIAWIGGAFIMLGKLYYDGKKSNHGEANPFKWDYSKMNYVIGFSTGGGNSGVYAGAGWNNDFAFAAGYNGRDYSIGYVQNGQTHMAPFRDRANEALQQAGKKIDETINIIKENSNNFINDAYELYNTSQTQMTSQLVQGSATIQDLFEINNGLSNVAKRLSFIDIANEYGHYYYSEQSGRKTTYNIVYDVTLLVIPSSVGAPITTLDLMGRQFSYYFAKFVSEFEIQYQKAVNSFNPLNWGSSYFW